MCTTSFPHTMDVKMGEAHVVPDLVGIANSHLMDVTCICLGCGLELGSWIDEELLCFLKCFGVQAQITSKGSENTMERFMRISIAIFFSDKFSSLVHLRLIILKCDRV